MSNKQNNNNNRSSSKQENSRTDQVVSQDVSQEEANEKQQNNIVEGVALETPVQQIEEQEVKAEVVEKQLEKNPEAEKEEKEEAKVESKKEVEKLSSDSTFEQRLAWIKEHGSMHEKHTVTVMENYVQVGLTSISLERLAAEQLRFWRLFEYMHNQPAEFQKLYGIIIMFAKEYQDKLFNLSVMFRAQSSLSLSLDQLVAFNQLRTLILNTIQTKDISKVKTLIDIRKIVEHDSIPENVRGLYVEYYL